MDRFIRVNGKEFSFEEVANALGVECDPQREPVQVHLCQRVNDGVLVAKGAFFDNDDYPAIDLELELPAEKDSMPVMIFKTEQPRVAGGYSDGYPGVRSFVYNRDGEYFMYSDVDSRADVVVDRDGMEQRVMVSGSPTCDVEVYQENSWARFMGQKDFVYRANVQATENVKLEVGMVGTIKDEIGVKEEFRGKDFKILAVGATKEDEFAVCLVEGRDDIIVWRKNMDSVRMPEIMLENTLAAAVQRSHDAEQCSAGVRSLGLGVKDSIDK